MTKRTPARRDAAQPTATRPRLTLVETPPAQADAVGASFEGDKKARAKTLLQAMLFQAELHPEFATHLEPAIEALKTEIRRTPRSTRDRILLMLEPVTGLTFEEIEGDLRMPADEIWVFLKELAGDGLVEIVTTGRRITPANGRVEYFIKLSHTSPTGDHYSAPAPGRSSAQLLADSLD